MTLLASHLSAFEGDLYDDRDSLFHPLRANYARSHSAIKSVADLKATLRHGQYAWPGGYPMYFITSDGGALSFATVRAELRNVVWSIRNRVSDGWRVVACAVNYENSQLTDDHTGERIESAYSDDNDNDVTEVDESSPKDSI